MTPETVTLLVNALASAVATYIGVLTQGWMDRRRHSRGGHMQ